MANNKISISCLCSLTNYLKFSRGMCWDPSGRKEDFFNGPRKAILVLENKSKQKLIKDYS
jgi:hypothetical protein